MRSEKFEWRVGRAGLNGGWGSCDGAKGLVRRGGARVPSGARHCAFADGSGRGWFFGLEDAGVSDSREVALRGTRRSTDLSC